MNQSLKVRFSSGWMAYAALGLSVLLRSCSIVSKCDLEGGCCTHILAEHALRPRDEMGIGARDKRGSKEESREEGHGDES